MSMMLSELLPTPLVSAEVLARDVLVSGLGDDSRHIVAGDAFCACTGASVDGKTHVQEAISKGAVAVLFEPPAPALADVVPMIGVANLRQELGVLASRFFGYPTRDIDVIAVTGTNGKTSFTCMLAQSLGALGITCGTVGTLGCSLTPGRIDEPAAGDLSDESVPVWAPGLTTPPAIQLQAHFRALVDLGCTAIAVEASSHGLVQGRLNGSDIDLAVFTNLTHDHLDYHDTIEQYQAAKRRLFEFSSLQGVVINIDDAFGRVLASDLTEESANKPTVTTYSLTDQAADVYCLAQTYTDSGTHLLVSVGGDRIETRLPLFGRFNTQNLLAVLATLVAMDRHEKFVQRVSPFSAALSAALSVITPVKGRMDVIRWPVEKPSTRSWPTIVVDYAHTPDALEQCLVALGEHFAGRRICCVFGCGGDRDTTKRAVMGAIAAKYAHQVIVTDDNPRGECPAVIVEDILAGVTSDQVEVIHDRRAAIHHAITRATEGEVVLVAGKGHEDYQDLAGERIHLSDHEVIRHLLEGEAVAGTEEGVVGVNRRANKHEQET